MNKFFWAEINYTYDSTHENYPRLIGGQVYAFCYVESVDEFIQSIFAMFKQERLNIDEFEFVKIYNENLEWESEEDAEKYAMILDQAKQSLGEVILDDFYAYETPVDIA